MRKRTKDLLKCINKYSNMSNYVDITCNNDKERAKSIIDKIDINNNIRIFIDKRDNIKTLQQVKYFHKILAEFTEFMINNNYSQNEVNDWKAIVKKNAHFFKSNTGITCLDKDLKKRLFLTIEKGNFTKEEREEIYLCFREQSLKSLSEADTKEANLLIDEAILLCVNTFTSLIDFGMIDKRNLIQDLKHNHQTLYDMIIKWKEGFLKQEITQIATKQQEIYDKMNNFFIDN